MHCVVKRHCKTFKDVYAQVNGSELVWGSNPSGPPQLDPRGAYKLPEGGFAAMGPTVSPVALSKFLTAMSGKQFQNPPSEMLVSRGLLIHDLLEQFSGKPMPGRVRSSPSVTCILLKLLTAMLGKHFLSILSRRITKMP